MVVREVRSSYVARMIGSSVTSGTLKVQHLVAAIDGALLLGSPKTEQALTYLALKPFPFPGVWLSRLAYLSYGLWSQGVLSNAALEWVSLVHAVATQIGRSIAGCLYSSSIFLIALVKDTLS